MEEKCGRDLPVRDPPLKKYTVVELFAGAGGLALGLEKAGLSCLALNEIDKHACETLRKNRPNWNILEGDVKKIDFSVYKSQTHIVTGGFPCQAFSYAGKKLGFEDARGTLFYGMFTLGAFIYDTKLVRFHPFPL